MGPPPPSATSSKSISRGRATGSPSRPTPATSTCAGACSSSSTTARRSAPRNGRKAESVVETEPHTIRDPRSAIRAGKVWLIGAGPGDPELLTLKAARTLAVADVVLVDDLVDRRVLAHLKAG